MANTTSKAKDDELIRIFPEADINVVVVGGEANAIAPHKRMLSSVTPCFVESGDRVMIGGSPGGSLIMGMSLLATLEFLDGRAAADIVAEYYLAAVLDRSARRIRAQGDRS